MVKSRIFWFILWLGLILAEIDEHNIAETTGMSSCSPSEFRCNDSACIPSRLRCDKKLDCTDYSDEIGCEARNECSELQIKCPDGDCLDSNKICDGIGDCKDMSDEINCPFLQGFSSIVPVNDNTTEAQTFLDKLLNPSSNKSYDHDDYTSLLLASLGNGHLSFKQIFQPIVVSYKKTITTVCSVPIELVNGDVQVKKTPVLEGDIVTIHCHDGYVLFGESHLTCLNDNKWSYQFPTCEKVTECDSPPEVLLSTKSFDYSFPKHKRSYSGTNVTYNCRKELFVLGNTSMTCLENGKWSNSPPKCIMVSGKDIQCGTIGKEVVVQRDVLVKLKCPAGCFDTNYPLIGTVFYTHSSSVCKAAIHVGSISNAGGIVFLSHKGASSNFQGGNLNNLLSQGQTKRERTFKIFRAPSIDTVKKTGCPTGWLEVNTHCLYLVGKLNNWKVAQSTCRNMGSRLLELEDVPLLNSIQATFKTKKSSQYWLNSKTSGTVDLVVLWTREEGNSVEISSNVTGILIDEEEGDASECTVLELLENKLVWRKRPCYSPSFYYCIQRKKQEGDVACKDPGAIKGGFSDFSASEIRIGNVITYRCMPLYYLSGESTSVCQENSTWSSPKPSCIKINMCIDQPSLRFGSFRIIHPTEAMSLIGKRIRVGPIRNNTYNARKRLRATRSTLHSKYSNVQIPPGHYEINTVVVYSCDSDFYNLVGSKTRRCEEGGKWSGRSPTCIPICGRSSDPHRDNIKGGKITKEGQWPWVVNLGEILYGDDDIYCGGSLINEQWIVTAAHCVCTTAQQVVEVDSLVVYLGRYQRGNILDDNMVQKKQVEKIYVHENYNEFTNDNDIALLKLTLPAVFTPRVQPVCLPTETSSRINFVEGRNGTVIGWGLTGNNSTYAEFLMQATLPVVSNEKCRQDYLSRGKNHYISENMFCAGYPDGEKDACIGDSGGPMVFKNPVEPGNWVLEGIVSWGSIDGCGLPMERSAFTKVSKYLMWIENIGVN